MYNVGVNSLIDPSNVEQIGMATKSNEVLRMTNSDFRTTWENLPSRWKRRVLSRQNRGSNCWLFKTEEKGLGF